jgi:hypothetical protein
MAELHSLHLKRDGVELMAGEPFLDHLTEELGMSQRDASKVFRRSYGAVISRSMSGKPEDDFPADNFFDVYFAVKLPGEDGKTITLYNRDPLVVVDLGISTVPPLGRVTIPQFPFDQMDLYDVEQLESLKAGGAVVAGRGGCCAHSVSVPALPGIEAPAAEASPEDMLVFARLDFDTLLSGGPEGSERAESLAVPASPGGFGPGEGGVFEAVDHPFVDGVFQPHGITQISSSGLVVKFEEAGGAGPSAEIAPAGERDGCAPIDLDPPTSFEFLAPPQLSGLHLGPNGGITLDLEKVRNAFPRFYLVAMVGLEGLSRESPAGSGVRIQVLADGVSIPFADNTFAVPGASAPLHIDLQEGTRFLTMLSLPTGSSSGGNGAIALWELRGFGTLG